MIGLDTNVLVRLLVQDDPVQTEQAKRFVDRRCTAQEPGFINCVVLAELSWVLARTYGYERSEIADAISALVDGGDRVVEGRDQVRAALADYRSSRAGFVDCLIGYMNAAHGCEATATFDRGAAGLGQYLLVR